MMIYFACSLTGGRQDEAIYRTIVDYLVQSGHEVPTANLADPSIMEQEKLVDPRDVYQRDIAWMQECDCLIAEVSTPSHGVGFEVGFALNIGKPVLCCYQDGRMISKMITGNLSPSLVVRPYRDEKEAVSIVGEFLQSRLSPRGAPDLKPV